MSSQGGGGHGSKLEQQRRLLQSIRAKLSQPSSSGGENGKALLSESTSHGKSLEEEFSRLLVCLTSVQENEAAGEKLRAACRRTDELVKKHQQHAAEGQTGGRGIEGDADESDGEQDDDALEEENGAQDDPLKSLSEGIVGALVCDLRLNRYPPCAKGIQGFGDKPMFQKRENDESFYLMVPPGASLKLDFGQIFAQGDAQQQLPSYTVVIDMLVDLSRVADGGMSLISTAWPEPRDELDVVIMPTGVIKVLLKEFDEAPSGKVVVKSNTWCRAVVTFASDKLCSYVNGSLCGSVKSTVLSSGDRFWLKAQGVHLFAAKDKTAAPGLSVARVEVHKECWNAQQVNENRMRFWILPDHVKRLSGIAEREYRERLSLSGVVSNIVPFWQHGAFFGIFTDKFLSIKASHGVGVYPSMQVLGKLSSMVLSELRNEEAIAEDDKRRIEEAVGLVEENMVLARKVGTAVKDQSADAIGIVLKFLHKTIKAMEVGKWIMVPAGTKLEHQGEIIENDVMILVHRVESNKFQPWIVNSGAGVEFHPCLPSALPAKFRRQVAIKLDAVTYERIIDTSWWMYVFIFRCVPSSQNTPENFYEMLGSLSMRPFSDVAGEQDDKELLPDNFRTVQLGVVGYHKAVSEALVLLLQEKKVSLLSRKIFFLSLRRQALVMVRSDLKQQVQGLGYTERFCIEIGVRQTCYAAIKHVEEASRRFHGKPSSLGVDKWRETMLQNTLELAEGVLADVKSLGNQQEYTTMKSTGLDIGSGVIPEECQADLFPRFECFLADDDAEAIEDEEQRSSFPVDLMPESLFKRAKTLPDAVTVIREVHCNLALLNSRKSQVRLSYRLVIIMAQRLLTSALPIPLGSLSRERAGAPTCIWSSPLLYAQQKDLCLLLSSVAQQVATAAAAIKRDVWFHAVVGTCMAVLTAITDAVLRNKCTDKDGPVSMAMREGFGVDTTIYIKQAQVCPTFSAPLQAARAGVLEYFNQLKARNIPAQHKEVWSWEHKNFALSTNDEGNNIKFAEAVAGTMSLPADINTAYSQTPLPKQLFPEFEQYRDICLLFKWAMCPHPSVFPKDSPFYGDAFQAMPSYEIQNGQLVISVWDQQIFQEVSMSPGNYPPSGIRYESLANASHYTQPTEVMTEDDVLHMDSLPDFDGSLGQRDSELLISYLTVPYLRIPLIVNFFASDDRVYSLKNPVLRKMLERIMLEPGAYLGHVYNDGENASDGTNVFGSIIPTDVPCSNPALIATTHGLLLNELQHSPGSILIPLKRLLVWAINTADSSVNDQFFETALFITRITSRVVSLARYLLRGWSRREPGFEVWADSLAPTDENKEKLRKLVQEFDACLHGHSSGVESHLEEEALEEIPGEECKTWNGVTMRQRLIQRLQEVGNRSGLHCGLSKDISPDRASIDPEKREDDLLFFVKMCSDLHAHMLLIYRGLEIYDQEACTQALSSVLFLTTRHTWDRDGIWAPEPEVMEAIEEVRRRSEKFLCMAANEDVPAMVQVCQHVFASVMTRENTSAAWCRVKGVDTRFVVSPGVQGYAGGAMPSKAPVVRDGKYDVELDLSVIELRVSGGYLMSLDDDIASDANVTAVLGKDIVTLQCIAKKQTKACRVREIVGLGSKIMIHAWDKDRRTAPRDVYERDYIPQELAAEELWISKLFEPVRSRLFCPPACDVELTFYLSEHKYGASSRMASLVATHPNMSGAWMEVELIREFGVVNVYMMESYGMKFRRNLYYTNNVTLSYAYLQPDPGKREQAWAPWGRHEGSIGRNWETCRKKNSGFQPPPYAKSCAISRPVPAGVHVQASRPEPPPKEELAPSSDQKNEQEAGGEKGEGVDQAKEKEQKEKDIKNGEDNVAEEECGHSDADDDGENEQYIPSRYLAGLVPQALSSQYCFWQSSWNKRIIRGYKTGHLKEGSGHGEASDHRVTIFIEDMETVASTSINGMSGRVQLHEAGGLEGQYHGGGEVLLDFLHASPESPLTSIARTLCAAENASNLLVWGTKLEAGAGVRITRLQMLRMRQEFVVKEHQDVAEKEAKLLLFSKDQPSVYIAHPSRAGAIEESLITGVNHNLRLCSLERESSVMVPNVCFSRPPIKTLPFSTEIVLQYEDDPGREWCKRSKMSVFMYSVHPSGSSLVPNCLSAAIYLLALKMISRDYADASAMVPSISTDAEFTDQEENVLTCLEQTLSDRHPDAHAIRCKITLAVVDSPVNLPWDVREECANYFNKLRHVSAVCRLSEREEESLISAAILFNKIFKVVETACSRYEKGSLQGWHNILTDQSERKLKAPQDVADAEACVATITQMIQASVGVLCHRNKVVHIIPLALKKQNLAPHLWKVITNQESLFMFTKKEAQIAQRPDGGKAVGKGLRQLNCTFPSRLRTSGRENYVDKKVLKMRLEDLQKETSSSKSDFKKSATGSLSQSTAIRNAVIVWQRPQLKLGGNSKYWGFFMLMILKGACSFKMYGTDAVSYVKMFLRFGFEDASRGTIFGAILNLLVRHSHLNPHLKDLLVNIPCHKALLVDSSEEGFNASYLYLRRVVEYIQQNAAFIESQSPVRVQPSTFKARAMVHLPQPTLLDECPSLSVSDFDAAERTLDCSEKIQIAWSTMLAQSQGSSSLPVYSASIVEALAKRPMDECAKAFLSSCPQSETPEMAFDAEDLGSRAGAVEKKIITRLSDDYKELKKLTMSASPMELSCLSDECLQRIKSEAQTLTHGSICSCGPSVQEAIARVMLLSQKVEEQQNRDSEAFLAIKTALEIAANGDMVAKSHERRYRMLIRSGHRPRMGFGFLLTTLMSKAGGGEWKRINPHLDADQSNAGQGLLAIALLHATRVSQCNRVLTELNGLSRVLHDITIGALSPDQGCILAMQKSQMLGELLTAGRSYFEKSASDDNFKYRPHFLIFEFQKGIILRDRQVTLVCDIISSLQQSPPKPIVKQMIMGQGKTCVISPLLGLSLADTRRLILQVVPSALLDFSRAELRKALSNTLGRRVYTISFERSSIIDSRIYNKLRNAAETGSVVVTTPASVKSLVLKFVENMMIVADRDSPGRIEAQRQVREARELFNLLREAVVIMDEVDMILHPLKSELNFPFGEKHPLQLESRRWVLPMFLINAFHMACGDGKVHVASSALQKIVDDIHSELQRGKKMMFLQTEPHWVLINTDFYRESLLELFAKLCVLWLEQQDMIESSESAGVLKFIIAKTVTQIEGQSEETWECFKSLDEIGRQVVNLARLWVHTIMPHVLVKVNRVSYGIMTSKQCASALENNPFTPRGRLVLAVPFIGKDVPSPASEFAHPDVAIGLTYLAYVYEGLRISDFREVLSAMQAQFSKELGPYDRRPTALRFAQWVELAGGKVAAGQASQQQQLTEEQQNVSNIIQPLHRLRRTNVVQVEKAFKLLGKLKALVSWYLNNFVYPRYTLHQKVKLSACAQELGSSMIFTRRVGFSGTPSSLIPRDLGECVFEPGSEANIMSTLTKSSIIDKSQISKNWTPATVLETIARDERCFMAMIDTGALVTGFSNEDVARYLLKSGLKDRQVPIQGVVYLDEMDRKMVLVEATGKSVRLEECGIPASRRFAFYDQVHTTGMDIQHTPDARAALTFGKDMILRDLAQGAYRMRGIGKGQRISIFVTPEVEDLIEREVSAAMAKRLHKDKDNAKLIDMTIWLLINSMRQESMQYSQLQLQNVQNAYRKTALSELLGTTDSLCSSIGESFFKESLGVFQERVDFDLPSEVLPDVTVSQRVAMLKEEHQNLLLRGGNTHEVDDVLRELTVGEGSGMNFDGESQMTQEKQQEQEQEQQQEQEIEIEKAADLDYRKDEEKPKSWNFSDIVLIDDPAKLGPFYPMSKFCLWGRDPLRFPTSLAVSNNYYNPRWSGERRIKNTVMVLDLIPNKTSYAIDDSPLLLDLLEKGLAEGLEDEQELRDCLTECAKLLWSLRTRGTGASEKDALKDLARCVMMGLTSSRDVWEDEIEDARPWIESKKLDMIVGELADGTREWSEALLKILSNRKFYQEHKGRYEVLVSLSEAETIRRIMHLREGECVIEQSQGASMCLRCLSDFDEPLDVSKGYEEPYPFQQQTVKQLLKFFDGELFFSHKQMLLITRALTFDRLHERQVFFEDTLARRRRPQVEWEKTPLAKVFAHRSEMQLAVPHVQKMAVTQLLQHMNIGLGDAFNMFDTSKDGALQATEVWEMLSWAGLEPTPLQVLSFMSLVDADNSKEVDQDEFKDSLYDQSTVRLSKRPEVMKKRRRSIIAQASPCPVGKQPTVEILSIEETERLAKERKMLLEHAEQESKKDHAKQNEAAVSLRLKHKNFRDRAKVDTGCNLCGGNLDESGKPNPHVLGKKLRWEFTMSTVTPDFCTLSGCNEFLLDSDGANESGNKLQKKKANDSAETKLKRLGLRYFMRLEGKTVAKFSIPNELIPEDTSAGSSMSALHTYSMSMCARIPVLGLPRTTLMHIGELHLVVYPSGLLGLESEKLGQGYQDEDDMEVDEQDEDHDRKLKIVDNEWFVITVVVVTSSTTPLLQIYLDGTEVKYLQESAKSLGFNGGSSDRVGTTSSFALPVHRFYIMSSGQTATNVTSTAGQVRSDLKFVQLDMCALDHGEVLAVHVPMGVWSCPCSARNGIANKYCRECDAEKVKSGARPPNDMSPDHEGLTIVVSQSFEEIVLNTEKHVFLDVSADWCGPSVAMFPALCDLAYLLRHNDDIIIAKMDTDTNEKDQFYLSETFVPNLKLFPKGEKADFVGFPETMERNLDGFISFLESHCDVKFIEMRKQKYPDYCKEKDIPALVQEVQDALVCFYDQYCLHEEDEAMNEHDTVTGRLPGARQFLDMYFSDMDVFKQPITDFNISPHQPLLTPVKDLMQAIDIEIADCLLQALPDKPQEYLARSLAHRTCTGSGAEPGESGKDLMAAQWLTMLDAALAAVQRGNLREFEAVLDKGLPVTRHPGGVSILCFCAAHGLLRAVELLYNKGADLSETMKQGSLKLTSMDFAAIMGYKEVVNFLVDRGACFSRSLHLASESGQVDVVRLLLKRGAHPGVRFEGHSAISLAVLNQRDAVLNLFIKWYSQGASVSRGQELSFFNLFNLDDNLCKSLNVAKGSNLLHVAAKNALMDCIHTIMTSRFSALASQKNSEDEIPFDVAEVAVKPYINPNYLNSLTILRKCVIGNISVESKQKAFNELQEIFQRKEGDANAQDVRGWTALMAAAIANDEKSCNLLLQYGAKWNTLNRNGFSALFWAHAAGSNEVIEILERKGASLSATDTRGLFRLNEMVQGDDKQSSELCKFRTMEYRMASPPSKDMTKNPYFEGVIQRMMDDAASLGDDLSKILPASYFPDVSLEESILALDMHAEKVPVVAEEDREQPGEGDFDTWQQLVEHSRLFVQERVAGGDPLPPPLILALHLYTIPSNLFRFTNRAMRTKEGLELYKPFAWYLWRAVENLTTRTKLVYRGLFGVTPRIIIGGKENIVWSSFSSTSASHNVACSFMYKQPGQGGLVFKIAAKSCREIMKYSYKPLERELLLPPCTSFVIKGVYELSEYSIKYGAVGGMNIVKLQDVSKRLGEFDNKFVLVEMEERAVDLDDQPF